MPAAWPLACTIPNVPAANPDEVEVWFFSENTAFPYAGGQGS